MTYTLCRKLIESGNYDKNGLKDKLDVFLLGDRISREQYEELTALVGAAEE